MATRDISAAAAIAEADSAAAAQLAHQLSRCSTPYEDPLARIEWDRLDLEAPWLPEAAVSLHGVPEFEALPRAVRVRLSQYEFLNFIDAGLWLEGYFMERIARAMNRADLARYTLRYRLHELREEAGHSLMFLELMQRAGLPLPERRAPGRFRFARLFGRYAPMESTAFWMAAVIGEELPDRLNRFIREHAEGLCPVIVQMSTLHQIDEARHIRYARSRFERRLEAMPAWRRSLLAPLMRVLLRQFVEFFYYPGWALYELAGLKPGQRWAAAARTNPARTAFVNRCLEPTIASFARLGLRLHWRT
jgi:hypothetical protein